MDSCAIEKDSVYSGTTEPQIEWLQVTVLFFGFLADIVQPLVAFQECTLEQILVLLRQRALVALCIALVLLQHFFHNVYKCFFYESADVVPELAMTVVYSEYVLRVIFRPFYTWAQDVRILVHLVRIHGNVAHARCKSIFGYHVFWYVEFV